MFKESRIVYKSISFRLPHLDYSIEQSIVDFDASNDSLFLVISRTDSGIRVLHCSVEIRVVPTRFWTVEDHV